MAQEFTIKSQDIEDKINQLLPSQGGFQPGVDFSASTMVVPIVDLTETAEGSNLRQDLQRATSFTSATFTSVSNGTTTIVNTTGYFNLNLVYESRGAYGEVNVIINDGTTDKTIRKYRSNLQGTNNYQFWKMDNFDVLLTAGDTLKVSSSDTVTFAYCTTRQIADLQGNLVNP